MSPLFLSCLLRVCCSGQLHVDLMIIFCNHADQTDTGAAFWLPGRISPRTCCLVVEESSFAVMHMHEKWCLCCSGHFNRTPQPVMCRSVSGFICVHLLEPILHIHSAWFSRKVVCCHTCPRRNRCCLVCSSAACCLFVAQGSSCSSRDHTTLTRQTQVLPSCCL